jgi:hypothetical protein
MINKWLIVDQFTVCLKDSSICLHLKKFDCKEDDSISNSSVLKFKNKKKIETVKSHKKSVLESDQDENFFY